MPYTAPSSGTRVRHTTTFAGGAAWTVEGIVEPDTDPTVTEPHVIIGDGFDRIARLEDKPGEYSVALEVVDNPTQLLVRYWSCQDNDGGVVRIEESQRTDRGLIYVSTAYGFVPNTAARNLADWVTALVDHVGAQPE